MPAYKQPDNTPHTICCACSLHNTNVLQQAPQHTTGPQHMFEKRADPLTNVTHSWQLQGVSSAVRHRHNGDCSAV